MRTKEIDVKIDYAIELNRRYQIGKNQMKRITKNLLWDLFKKDKNIDYSVFVTDSENKHFLFCISKAGRYSGFDISVDCCYNDYELFEMGYPFDINSLDDTEFSNALYIDYLNGQHRALDYQYCEYEFNRN